MSDASATASNETLVTLTADIVSAHVSNNNITQAELPELIGSVFAALSGLEAPAEPAPVRQKPAVSIRTSVKPDYIICLEDGKKLKMLKRYLRTNFDMSPDEYRRKWGLPSDYPMVAPDYSEKRRKLAHMIGLGRKAADEDLVPPEPVIEEAPTPVPEVAEDAPPAPKAKRGRPAKSVEAAPVAAVMAASTDKPARKPRAKKANSGEASTQPADA